MSRRHMRGSPTRRTNGSSCTSPSSSSRPSSPWECECCWTGFSRSPRRSPACSSLSGWCSSAPSTRSPESQSVLTRHANDLVGEEKATVVGAIDFLFQDSRLARGDNYSVLGILGQFSWVALVLAAIVALWRAGLSRLIVGATVLSALFVPTPATRPRSGWSPSSLPSFCGSERRTAKLLRDGRRKRPRETRRLLQSQWRGGRYPGSGYRIKRRQRFSRISSS